VGGSRTKRKKRKKKMEKTTKLETLHDRIYGARPSHKHMSPVSGLTWQCNSPYCEEMNVPHPIEEGGFEPVIQGREPWRGGL